MPVRPAGTLFLTLKLINVHNLGDWTAGNSETGKRRRLGTPPRAGLSYKRVEGEAYTRVYLRVYKGVYTTRVYHRVYIGGIYHPGIPQGVHGRYIPPRVYLRVYKGGIYTTQGIPQGT